jgi:hypothetical protein
MRYPYRVKRPKQEFPPPRQPLQRRETRPDVITPVEYGGLQKAYEHFNAELFGSVLPNVFITYQRRAHSYGYFSADRFAGRDDPDRRHELALNPDGFIGQSDQDICSTLVHEMVHGWQHNNGTAPKRSYHNKEWAAKMKAVGLYPSNSGMIGGRETGASMSHYIIPEGAFASRHLAAGSRTQIEQIYRNRIRINPVRGPFDPRTGRRWSPGATISPQRPSVALLHALRQCNARPTTRIDLSLEYVSDDPRALWEALVEALWLQWPTSRRRPVIVKGHTAYFARQSANRNVVLYWHKRSKITGEPCVRIDIRLRNRAIRSHQLGSVDAMLAGIPATVINHNLRIADDEANLVPLPAALIPERLTWPSQPHTRDSMKITPRPHTTPRGAATSSPASLWRANRSFQPIQPANNASPSLAAFTAAPPARSPVRPAYTAADPASPTLTGDTMIQTSAYAILPRYRFLTLEGPMSLRRRDFIAGLGGAAAMAARGKSAAGRPRAAHRRAHTRR